MANELDPVQRRKVIAAARTAASWARARRAAWPSLEEAPPAAAHDAAGEAAFAPAETVASPEIAPSSSIEPRAPAEPRIETIKRAGAAAIDRAGEWMRPLGPPLVRWLPRIAIALVVLGAAAAAGSYVWSRIGTLREAVRRPPASPPARAATAPRGGTLSVKSTPAGARVIVDGRERGVTPITLTDLSLGRHAVTLQSVDGTIQRSIAIAPGDTASIDEAIFGGWIAIYSPFEVSIVEGTRALRADDRNQIMLPAGPHDVHLINRTLGYDETRHVDLKPGEITRVTVTPPRSTITVTAAEPGEVWIDGSRVGDTPVDALPIDLGTHNVSIRRAGNERRFTVTVTVKPLTLNADK